MADRLLCLFDIDGTLVEVAEHRAFSQAFQDHCGPAVDMSFLPGRLVSDSGYIFDVLSRSYGRPPSADEIALLSSRFITALDALTASGETPVRVVGGAPAFLARLAERAALAVSTGCIESSARLKLRHAGLDHAFPCGGYSCDERSRADIVRRAIAAAERCYATPFTRTVLFGDGPWDLTSAVEAGIDFIGINEKERGRARLHEAGAAHVFADYADAEAILRVLG